MGTLPVFILIAVSCTIGSPPSETGKKLRNGPSQESHFLNACFLNAWVCVYIYIYIHIENQNTDCEVRCNRYRHVRNPNMLETGCVSGKRPRGVPAWPYRRVHLMENVIVNNIQQNDKDAQSLYASAGE